MPRDPNEALLRKVLKAAIEIFDELAEKYESEGAIRIDNGATVIGDRTGLPPATVLPLLYTLERRKKVRLVRRSGHQLGVFPPVASQVLEAVRRKSNPFRLAERLAVRQIEQTEQREKRDRPPTELELLQERFDELERRYETALSDVTKANNKAKAADNRCQAAEDETAALERKRNKLKADYQKLRDALATATELANQVPSLKRDIERLQQLLDEQTLVSSEDAELAFALGIVPSVREEVSL